MFEVFDIKLVVMNIFLLIGKERIVFHQAASLLSYTWYRDP